MWPFSRRELQKPIRASFDLAQTTAGNRKHWANADGLSARAATSAAVRRVVRIRSRYEAENNSWYSGILRTVVNHVVGGGPRLQMLTADPAANSRLEKAWRTWARKIDLAEMLRTMVEAYWRDGEVFVMRADRPQNFPLSLDLRTFEADQVSTPWISTAYNDPFTDDGIRFDRSTNELEIYVYDHHPGSNVPLNTLNGNWYSSREVLHLFRIERPGQTRGIPRATPALQTLPIMRRQELATLYSAETAANFAMYLKSNSPSLDPTSSPADFAEIEIARNMLTTLPAGWDIGQVEPKQPGPLYEMFQRQALQSFSRCTNMPYTLAAGTGKDANFSSFKGDMKNVWEPEVRTEQSRVELSIIEPVFRWFLESCIYVPGLLNGMPAIADIDHKWHWPPLPELDALDAANAAAIRLSTLQSTLTDEFSRRGMDAETEIARAATDWGVDVPTLKAAVFAKTFDKTSASTITTVDPGATSVADTAMNGAQVTSIVEIISQVAAGVIPSISAAALIRSAFPAIPVANVDAMLAPFAAVAAQVGVPGGVPMPQGEYTQVGQRVFTNNQKRIQKTLQQLAAGEISQVMAEQTLASIGLAPDRIAALIADALDGGVEDDTVATIQAGGPGSGPNPGSGTATKTKSSATRTKAQPMSAKAARAKAAHVMVGKAEQQEADVAEQAMAKSIGGASFKNSEPVDIVVGGPSGAIEHGIEHKFMFANANAKITMNKYAQVRKVEWEKKNKATFHTVVESKNGDVFYRRGVGSFRVGGMHKVTGGKSELKKLLKTADDMLPAAAMRTDAALRSGSWKPAKDGRGYVNSKTGETVRPKK